MTIFMAKYFTADKILLIVPLHRLYTEAQIGKVI